MKTHKKYANMRLGAPILIILTCLIVVFIAGCTSLRSPVITQYDDSVSNYRYFYISSTGTYTSSTPVYGSKYGVYGGIVKSTDPASIIAGILIKNGFTQVQEVLPNNARETMIINFAETGRRNVNFGYSIEVTIQFVSALTQHNICTCTAEGQGETEADDVRAAIQRALRPLFNQNH